MTDEKLKALAEKATPGPWRCEKTGFVIAGTGGKQGKGWVIADARFSGKVDWPYDRDYIIAACNETPKLLERIALANQLFKRIDATFDAAYAETARGIIRNLIREYFKADDEAQGHD